MSNPTYDESFAFMREHAGYSVAIGETREQGRDRSARELALAEQSYLADDSLFVVWQEDDIDSSFFDKDTDDPRPLYVCLLCTDASYEDAHLVRGYDPQDGIFERPGRVLASLGGIGVDDDDPYKRVVVAELAAELEYDRESVLVRGDN